MLNKLYKKYQQWIDLVGGFAFIVGLFYMFYVSLWIFCPCG